MPTISLRAKPGGVRLAALLRAVLGRAPGRPRRKGPRLDPRGLSDHLKRDLGFLDGNDPTCPRP